MNGQVSYDTCCKIRYMISARDMLFGSRKEESELGFVAHVSPYYDLGKVCEKTLTLNVSVKWCTPEYFNLSMRKRV